MCSPGDRREDEILILIGAESKEHVEGSRPWNFIVTCYWMTRPEAEGWMCVLFASPLILDSGGSRKRGLNPMMSIKPYNYLP